ncbi:hypothetical protein [Streptomyces sp. NPDC101249]|uniref:hypothetical protein n=1 Tax=Streptomyces sp. NPDC101249 TaxID=3366140 RepID=UPI00381C904E
MSTPPEPTPPTPADIPPRKNPPAVEPLRDDDGLVMTQERFGQTMAKERRAGRHAAFRELAEAAGLPFDIDSFDPKKFGSMFKEADEARKAKLTEAERRADEIRQREEDLVTRAAAVEQREQAAQQLAHQTRIRAALVGLGAAGADLDDATALLRVAEDASDDELAKAAGDLKERRPEMFGAAAAPAGPPPAPSGMPAPGMPHPGGAQPKPGERGLAMLKRRGKVPSDA